MSIGVGIIGGSPSAHQTIMLPQMQVVFIVQQQIYLLKVLLNPGPSEGFQYRQSQ
jgi:hypothetical protein